MRLRTPKSLNSPNAQYVSAFMPLRTHQARRLWDLLIEFTPPSLKRTSHALAVEKAIVVVDQ